MTAYDDFLAAYPAQYRYPFHSDLLTSIGGSYFSSQVGEFAPIAIPNLPGRKGLATGHLLNTGTLPVEPLTNVPQTIAFVLSVPKNFISTTVGLYSNGDSTNGVAIIFDLDTIRVVGCDSSVGSVVAFHQLLTPGVHTVGLWWDVDDIKLYVDGVLVDSNQSPITDQNGEVITDANGEPITENIKAARVNSTGNPRYGYAATRWPLPSGIWAVKIDGSGLLMSEFVHWHTAMTDIGDAGHLAYYQSLLVAPTIPADISVSSPTITIGTLPPLDVMIEFEHEHIRPVRWVDIYDADQNLLHEKVAVETGTVSIDMDRDERRNLDITFAEDSDEDHQLGYGPDDFWYDKLIYPYRGIELANGDVWATPLGIFMPDSISRPHFPARMTVSARDLTKKLMINKFADTTTFAAGSNVGVVVSAIATNGGVTSQNFAATALTLTEDVTFDRGTPRFQAMKDLTQSISFEIYFDASGVLVFRPYVDPLTALTIYTFGDGVDSNLASYERSTNDSRLFNDVVVYGSSTDNALVWAQAQNTDPSSPTRIAKIGRRTKPMPSQFVANNSAAQQMADAFLKVAGLEQYDVNFNGIVLPWLEVGNAIEFLVSDAAPSDPTRFLLSTLTIPLGLEAMSSSARRVTIVG